MQQTFLTFWFPSCDLCSRSLKQRLPTPMHLILTPNSQSGHARHARRQLRKAGATYACWEVFHARNVPHGQGVQVGQAADVEAWKLQTEDDSPQAPTTVAWSVYQPSCSETVAQPSSPLLRARRKLADHAPLQPVSRSDVRPPRCWVLKTLAVIAWTRTPAGQGRTQPRQAQHTPP